MFFFLNVSLATGMLQNVIFLIKRLIYVLTVGGRSPRLGVNHVYGVFGDLLFMLECIFFLILESISDSMDLENYSTSVSVFLQWF